MLRIKSITNKDGTKRTDGRYPLRIGCIGKMWLLESDEAMMFAYEKDNQGNEKTGYLRSSIVEDYELFKNGVTVYTMNSIYYFEKI